jgi:alpha-amylase/alpha-mannosidase (GH57 family)
MSTSPLSLVFLWHMHQPDYRVRSAQGEQFAQPWVYLHALKDYADMAAHLERHSRVRAVVNFSSVLLDQLQDYCAQFAEGELRDPLLALLAAPARPLSASERQYLGAQCFKIKRETMVLAYPAFAELEQRCAAAIHGAPGEWSKLPEQVLWDVLTWYHLAWCGETVKRSEPLVQTLVAKGCDFSAADRQALLAVVGRVVGGVLARYRALMARGQIELSMTPHGHPIAPLLLDFACAAEADPGAALPSHAVYPGGEDRLRWHIRASRQLFAQCFGVEPAGVWPAEGALSDAVLHVLHEEGVQWTASNESLLRRSLGLDKQSACTEVGQVCRLDDGQSPAILFRHELISEFFGYHYAQLTPDEAVNHFLGQARRAAAQARPGSRPVLAMILDGENAWEHYPANAYDFFETLYARVGAAPYLVSTTVSDYLRDADDADDAVPLAHIVPGSWVFGGFSLWIGDARRNAAWDRLCELKMAFDAAVAAGQLEGDALLLAEQALARCESSDWFWWLGLDEPADAVLTFDQGFRTALEAAYASLGGQHPPRFGQAMSRIGAQHKEPVSVNELAVAIARVMGLSMMADVPGAQLRWTEADTSGVETFCSSEALSGWLFLLPSITLASDQHGGAFKYAEIKIALEKSGRRYFEAQATLSQGDVLPALLVAGVDVDGAQYLVDRFRLPASLFGQLGEKPRFLSCS